MHFGVCMYVCECQLIGIQHATEHLHFSSFLAAAAKKTLAKINCSL